MQKSANVLEINSLPPLPLLHEATLSYLKTRKNLLAFSGGGDSTALFFLLLEHGIPFDIAHVNYQTRAQSNAEEQYARALAKNYQKEAFIFTCNLSPKNFEHNARHARYTFFERVIQEKEYDTLLSAHHLGDRLEWLLMQLCKGAGVVELLGMQEMEEKEGYMLIRPLLHLNKTSLLHYLNEKGAAYFHDESNDEETYVRNYFRHHHASKLIETYASGIAKSFDYLEEDAKRLLPKAMKHIEELFIIEQANDELLNIRSIDKALKKLGIVASYAQRQEILRTHDCVVGGKVAVCYSDGAIYVAPFCTDTMDKSFKELCRCARVPHKIRPYLYKKGIFPNALLR